MRRVAPHEPLYHTDMTGGRWRVYDQLPGLVAPPGTLGAVARLFVRERDRWAFVAMRRATTRLT